MVIVKRYTLPVFILFISVIAILNNVNFLNVPKLFVSLIGIIAVVLFFLKRREVEWFVKIWIYAQFPHIVSESTTVLESGINVVEKNNYWNTVQYFDFNLGVQLNSVYFAINLAPFLFLGFYYFLKSSKYINRKVHLNIQIKRNKQFENNFPLKGIIKHFIKFEDSETWLIIKPEKGFEFDNATYEYLLTHPQNDSFFKLGKQQQSLLRLIPKEFNVDKPSISKKEYPFIGNVIVKVD